MRQHLNLLLLLLLLAATARAQTFTPDWESLDARPTPAWWTDAKFGIFIHWGVYSVPAYTKKGSYAEWYQHSLENNTNSGLVRQFHQNNYGARTYYDLADDFHADLFNPDDWAKLFERSGARYVVLTSKHHDGYCLWPSIHANRTWGFPWNSVERGPRRDLIGELFTSLNRTKVKPGLYFSLYEWFNPLWKADPKRFAQDHTMPQLYDLVQRYEPWVVWSDGDWDALPETWESPQFLAWLYNQSSVRSRVVVNDRWGSGVRFKHGGIYTPEYQPELEFENHDWEESRGMGYSYGYNRAEDAEDYNSSQSLVLHLCDKVSRGGNFLLDIGPDAHGQIPPIMQERLLDIGRWLDVNGEAIYNTRRWRSTNQWSAGRRDLKPELIDGWKTGGDLLLKQTVEPPAGFARIEHFYTYNPANNTLYAILTQYPTDRKVTLRGISIPPGSEVTLLGSTDKLRRENIGANTILFLPEYNPSKMKTPQAFVLKISNFGAFTPKPEIRLSYDPKTMQPTVTLHHKQSDAVIRYTTDGSEPSSVSPIYSAPLQPKLEVNIKAKAFSAGKLESNTQEQTVKTYPFMPAMSLFQAPKPGLQMMEKAVAEYKCSAIEKGRTTQQSLVRNFELPPACNGNKCAVLWRGYINIPETGGYQFWTESDDGSMLYIDGVPVVDNEGDHGMESKTGFAYLAQGQHQIQLRYYDAGGGYGLKVHFAPVGKQKMPIPESWLGN